MLQPGTYVPGYVKDSLVTAATLAYQPAIFFIRNLRIPYVSKEKGWFTIVCSIKQGFFCSDDASLVTSVNKPTKQPYLAQSSKIVKETLQLINHCRSFERNKLDYKKNFRVHAILSGVQCSS